LEGMNYNREVRCLAIRLVRNRRKTFLSKTGKLGKSILNRTPTKTGKNVSNISRNKQVAEEIFSKVGKEAMLERKGCTLSFGNETIFNRVLSKERGRGSRKAAEKLFCGKRKIVVKTGRLGDQRVFTWSTNLLGDAKGRFESGKRTEGAFYRGGGLSDTGTNARGDRKFFTNPRRKKYITRHEV